MRGEMSAFSLIVMSGLLDRVRNADTQMEYCVANVHLHYGKQFNLVFQGGSLRQGPAFAAIHTTEEQITGSGPRVWANDADCRQEYPVLKDPHVPSPGLYSVIRDIPVQAYTPTAFQQASLLIMLVCHL